MFRFHVAAAKIVNVSYIYWGVFIFVLSCLIFLKQRLAGLRTMPVLV